MLYSYSICLPEISLIDIARCWIQVEDLKVLCGGLGSFISQVGKFYVVGWDVFWWRAGRFQSVLDRCAKVSIVVRR